MKTLVTYRKVGMRYAILMLLGMALMIVAKPQSALALPTCLQGCLASLQVCNSNCHGIGACTTACSNQFAICHANCA
jgi:hypothetical protein